MKGDDHASMNLIEIIMISVGLSLDVFAVMICKGSLISKMEKKNLLKSCLIFASWQIVALLIGNLITKIPVFYNASQTVSKMWYTASAIIFAILGIYMIGKARDAKPFLERLENEFPTKEICLWACLTSLDAFFAGIGFGFLNTEVLIEAICLLIITVLFVLLGAYTGYHFGFKHRKNVYMFGGIILIAAALDVAIRYF
ncbi:MAG: manganese efflux pump MntP family protein [Velocimicrobium sp.]